MNPTFPFDPQTYKQSDVIVGKRLIDVAKKMFVPKGTLNLF